jgi:membrane-associated phospholipid phosphatase/tRNA A-37 threonylcarbamoyl transferase component Bud32
VSDARAISGVRRTRRRRRPSGAPPPLPHRIGPTTTAWLALAAILVSTAFLVSELTPWQRAVDQASTWLLRRLATVRTPGLTGPADWINTTGSTWHPVIGVAVVLLVIVFRRWRHLLVFALCLFLVEIVSGSISAALSRPRPYGVPVIGRWEGYSAPSPAVMTTTFLLVAGLYCLVVPGRPRSVARAVVAAVIAIFCLSRLYLAVDHPDDVLSGVVLGVAIPVAAFRYFTPDMMFPVAYRRGRTAHVDVTGSRGAAIRQAVQDQLGLTVLDLRPVGLESSAGSTPLRLTVQGDPDEYLFGKLYTRGHVRADRWYKLWRTILYGTLEDEHPFHSVRQLTQYEDYVLRLLRDAGIRSAAPYGIVEITPEREYLLVTEFFAGAVELGHADIDDGIIDQGLLLIRKLWDAGLAHRDIKPGNLMVRDGELLLIDAGFAQVRPSPWRQAVDLGNMMLVLAVRTDTERVYRRALEYFTPDELAEAVAATRGVASPTQLRAFMKRDPRDLLAEFRALAPPRRPIGLQRWGARRVIVAAAMLGAALLAAELAVDAFRPAVNTVTAAPSCGTSHDMILSAQAVPSSARLPCIAALPSGWTAGGAQIMNGRSLFWLDSDQAGPRAVTVTLTATCRTAGAVRIPSDQAGAERFELPLSLQPRFTLTRMYTFAGGCVTYQFSFVPGAAPLLAIPVDTAVAFEPRSALVRHVRRTEGLTLCGRGAQCPR